MTHLRSLYSCFVLLATVLHAVASSALPDHICRAIASQTADASGVVEVLIDSATYLVTVADGKPTSIKKPLFDPADTPVLDPATLNYIEEAIADHILGIKSPRYADVELMQGSWGALKGASMADKVSLSVAESKGCMLEVVTPTVICQIYVPLQYDKILGGSRGEIEQAFIDGLKGFTALGRKAPTFTIDDLQRIDTNVFVLKGNTYVLPEVNQDCYIEAGNDGEARFIADPKLPGATMANMINAGSGYEATLNLKILKHEYGTSETLSIPLETFIEYCQLCGCRVFWGLETLTDTLLKGTIFCFNPSQAYDHVISLECDPSGLGDRQFAINARGHLFVPVNNASNFFEEYKPKNRNEKIRVK